MDRNRALIVDVALILLCLQVIFGLNLSVYQTVSYNNPVRTSEFAHFVTHNETGAVYIGASDALYQLTQDFTEQQRVDTAVSECEGDCPNYNKVVLIDYAYNRLITCGSENMGTCQTRDLNDIRTVLKDGMQSVVASERLTTQAIIAPGPFNGGAYALYVAASHEEDRAEVNLLNRKTLGTDANFVFGTESTGLIRASSASTLPLFGTFIIRYIHAYVWKEFIHFVTHQRKEQKDDFVSKINRVCQDSEDFNSFTEITLECQGQNGIVYNLIQAAYVGAAGPDLAASLNISNGQDVFYGVFAKSEGMDGYVPSEQSALCVYRMQDIEAAFFKAVAGCLGGTDTANSDDHQVNYLQEAGGRCPGFSVSDTQVRAQLCTADNWRYAKGVDPLESVAVIEWSDIIPSSIITTTHRQHTIAFVGTTQGNMTKVHVVDKDKGREYERFFVGSHVLRDAEIDKDQEQLTILTKQQLLKLDVSSCDAYTTCDECIGVNGQQDGDPYCGWCTLERRCSRYNSCRMSNETSRWLSYNNTQCVGISIVSPYDNLPFTTTEQQIILTVEELPELTSGNSYQCIFDDIPPVAANKVGNELSCTTPAASNIPAIQSGNDHVTMQLYVYSTETRVRFVQRDFYFYGCNAHTGCVACTNSSWACDWCIYSNKCTHDNSTCAEDDSNSIINGINNPAISIRQGLERCPQLAAQNVEILLSDGISSQISVTGVNLPDDNKVNNYQCILDIDGVESTTEATRNGEKFTCNGKVYNYNANVQELDVGLSVVWNNDRRLDDIYGFTVTLYKCAVERPDCSRCLSNLTTRPELNCGWCSMDGKCSVQDNSHCSGGWMPSTTNNNCPNPSLIEVFPPSGPLKGNTVITITGSDLGKQLTDITSIKVGTEDCNMTGLEEEYEIASSVSCRTMSGTNNAMEPITVNVTGANGNPQQSTGEILFTYRDPSVSSFEPVEGPAAGGTIVTITGEYLDSCSDISATIGSECAMDRLKDVINSTTARCRTTSSSVDSSNKLTISFDEITTNQSMEEFTYRTNPTVGDVEPKKTIQSGGITLTVTGTGFRLAQTPKIILYVGDDNFTKDCQMHNDTMMLCKTPNIKSTAARRKRAAEGEASFGFIIGDVTDLLTWSNNNNITMEYFADPTYFPFENPREKSGDVELIMGTNLDSGSTERDVIVYIGTKKAVTKSLSEAILTIELPAENPGKDCILGSTTTDNPCVVVLHGNLVFDIGTIRYPPPGTSQSVVIGVVAAVCIILLVTLAVVLILYRFKVEGHKEDIGKLVLEMRDLETDIAEDIREAFVQLQTDVTDLTSDLEGTGMPFVPHRQYAISMFFAGLDTRPMTYDPEDTDEDVESAMLELSKLLSNKQFLIALIQTLDDDKSVSNKDRLTIASMLSVLMILEDKLPYLTNVMITLMASQVQDAIEEERPKRLFQRTELIVEKLLSNWIALSLYDFLKDHAAYPLFLLYRAIKCQSEKGPIDMVTGKSHSSLSDANIISERVVFKPMTLNAIVNDEDGEKKEVQVLDIDSIGQVKTKILDTIHRNRAYSSRMQPWQVDLEWRHGKSGHLVLQDVDVSSETEEGWKRVNTLKHFSVPEGANVALTSKQDVPNGQAAGQDVGRFSNLRNSASRNSISMSPNLSTVEEGVQLWHLVKEDGELEDEDRAVSVKRKSRKQTVREKKQIREITFPRLLGTKGTVQEYMDGMFAAILNTDDVPIGIKYIFDFFDGLAERYSIEDDTVLHQWKSNTLPLRFWQKIITNPQYVFDIPQAQYVEASLSVISQAFYDAFRKNPEEITKDASYRKLLYNREIPKYRNMVDDYYSSVTQMQRISKSALDADLKETCLKFTGLFSRVSTLLELHKLMTRYKSKLMETFEEDETYDRAGLAEKLEHVLSLLPDSSSGDPRYVYQQDVTTDE